MTIFDIGLDLESVRLLKSFIEKLGDAKNTFRYFNSRSPEIVSGHINTLGVLENNNMIGYGHLEKENDTVWLGIAVLPEAQRKGVGKFLMKHLLERARNFGLSEIFLTVDKDNLKALELYKKFEFFILQDLGKVYKLKLDLV